MLPTYKKACPYIGTGFCYQYNHKRGSARFSRLVGYFKLFVDCYCKNARLMYYTFNQEVTKANCFL